MMQVGIRMIGSYIVSPSALFRSRPNYSTCYNEISQKTRINTPLDPLYFKQINPACTPTIPAWIDLRGAQGLGSR